MRNLSSQCLWAISLRVGVLNKIAILRHIPPSLATELAWDNKFFASVFDAPGRNLHVAFDLSLWSLLLNVVRQSERKLLALLLGSNHGRLQIDLYSS